MRARKITKASAKAQVNEQITDRKGDAKKLEKGLWRLEQLKYLYDTVRNSRR
jgi:hypothetical protein